MKQYFTNEEYAEIERLVEKIISAKNKKEASIHLLKLKGFKMNLVGNINIILGELICYAEDAAGCVQDKDRKVSFVKQRLYVLKSYGVKDAEEK